MPDSPFLTDLAWLVIAAALVASAVAVFGPHLLDELDRAADAWTAYRDRTRIDRMARTSRRQETGR